MPRRSEPQGIDWKGRFVAEVARFVEIIRGEIDPRTGRVNVPDWGPRYQYPCFALAWLYATKHPANPHFGDRGVLDMALSLARHMISTQDAQGRFDGDDGHYGYIEWPTYFIARTCEVLGPALDAETRALALSSAEKYLAGVLPRPFVHTSFNHEAWRCLAAVASGQAFGRPEWVEAGTYLARQLVGIQKPAGYWEEGPHHGPSASYNYVMLEPLTMLVRCTGDEVLRSATDRLREFMLRFVFPDGTTFGSFDGRQSTQFGVTALGFSETPRGRRMNRLAAASAAKLEMDDPFGPHYSSSNWNSHYRPSYTADKAVYWLDGPEEALPQEHEGYAEAVLGDPFDGCALRSRGWMAALSGYVSDVPKQAPSVYRLERQSRIDLWHEAFGLVIGGGSNGSGGELPLANVHMVTGYGADVDFGVVAKGEPWDRMGNYMPRSGRSELTGGGGRITLQFGHGTCALSVRPKDERSCEIAFEIDSRLVRKAFVQLPLVVMDGGRLSVGGEDVPPATEGARPVRVTGAVEITSPLSAKTAVIVPPKGLECRLHPPVEPLRSYRGLSAVERYRPVFRVALLSARVDEPRSASGAFSVEMR